MRYCILESYEKRDILFKEGKLYYNILHFHFINLASQYYLWIYFIKWLTLLGDIGEHFYILLKGVIRILVKKKKIIWIPTNKIAHIILLITKSKKRRRTCLKHSFFKEQSKLWNQKLDFAPYLNIHLSRVNLKKMRARFSKFFIQNKKLLEFINQEALLDNLHYWVSKKKGKFLIINEKFQD